MSGPQRAGVPKVSVCMITYNHERFVAQAIESVLMQETPFPFELVIGEDCSSDNTRDIVLEYEARHPGVVRAVPAAANQGANRNFASTLRHCRGRYIATLEGDDYWILPTKLQRQADLLDRKPAYSMCCSKAVRFSGPGSASRILPLSAKPVCTLRDVLKGKFFQSCTAMYRREVFGTLPGWYYDVLTADVALFVMSACHGPIGLLDEVTAAYRVHHGGVYSGLGAIRQEEECLRTYLALRAHFGAEHRALIASRIVERSFGAAWHHAAAGNREKAARYARESLKVKPYYAGLWYRLLALKLLAGRVLFARQPSERGELSSIRRGE